MKKGIDVREKLGKLPEKARDFCFEAERRDLEAREANLHTWELIFNGHKVTKRERESERSEERSRGCGGRYINLDQTVMVR